MSKEEIIKILSKIKDTVGENNYKLALAITGHKTGKIKDIIMCSKDGELLLEYIEQLEQQCKKQKEIIDKAIEYITSYESISIIQGLTDTKDNKQLDEKTMAEMTNRYLLVHDKLLRILEDEEVSE